MNSFNLLGDIVQDDSQKWFESDVVPAMVIGWLAKQDGDVEININSLGGSVTGGLAIANALKGYAKGKVTANVMGVAASMASVIACAADEIKMGAGSFLMIHNPWSYAVGDADDLRKEADTLDKMKDAIIGFYQSKFSVSLIELSKLMDDETWIMDKDAETYGLAAAPYTEELKAAAKCDTSMMFARVPDAARAFFEVKARKAAAPAPSATDWEARYKGASKKLNDLQAAHKAELADIEAKHAAALADAEARHTAAVNDLNGQISVLRGDLETAKADLSTAVKRAETAEKDLAAKGEQLDRLSKAHALLTGGVLSPADGDAAEAKYRSDLDGAKSAEQREEIRRAHYAKAKPKK